MDHWNNFFDKPIPEYLMFLSMLSLNENEKGFLMEKLDFLFSLVEDIKNIEIENITPLYNLTENYNVFRDDEPGEILDHDKALKESQSILKNENYFIIMKNK
ncbi:MAG: Asp-tRNA(Asn)/Glu-tRNA(Gln) amidotransferase subunit GatC [Cytophagales bacterium]|jgi:aspartyl/glutamyl-tRNA(Asn/Gln) amidotransferase C subunit|nr:Asp-tRNA(Asn)/Glu-tRNA(Gln) amidotransferase subunit GatC [Cytophagales bacterium]